MVKHQRKREQGLQNVSQITLKTNLSSTGWQKKYSWQRPEKIFQNKPYKVIMSGLRTTDVKQRVLGDCWFCCALSALAEHPRRLSRIIISEDNQKNGCYCVALFVMGKWEAVILDDQFPYNNYSKKPAFTSSLEEELWVLLAEKALAKVYGGYAMLFSGYAYEALQMISGAPSMTYTTKTNSADQLFEIIQDAEMNDFVMACSTLTKPDLAKLYKMKQQKKIMGLAGSHAYSLIGYEELVEKGGRYELAGGGDRGKRHTLKLMKIRNPWASSEYTGKW